MTKAQIIKGVRAELKKHIDVPYRDGAINFIKEPIIAIGVRAGTVRKIARAYYKEMHAWDRKEVFEIAEELLKTGVQEESTIAFEWTYKRKKAYQAEDLKVFYRWLKKYADNWAKVDDLCTHIIGYTVAHYPELVPEVKKWTTSKNRWVRRASAVLWIHKDHRQKDFLKNVFWVAEKLMMDQDDLVQKGYGWMLKVASEQYPEEVLAFVIKHKAHMPRTALRYAIEKYPANQRKQAMS